MTFSPLSAWLKVETIIHFDNNSSSNPFFVTHAEYPAIKATGGKRKQPDGSEQDSK